MAAMLAASSAGERRGRSDDLPEGSPMEPVAPPTCTLRNSQIQTSDHQFQASWVRKGFLCMNSPQAYTQNLIHQDQGGTHQCDRAMASQDEMQQSDHSQEVPDVERLRCRVYAEVYCSRRRRCEVEMTSKTTASDHRLEQWLDAGSKGHVPRDLCYKTPLFHCIEHRGAGRLFERRRSRSAQSTERGAAWPPDGVAGGKVGPPSQRTPSDRHRQGDLLPEAFMKVSSS